MSSLRPRLGLSFEVAPPKASHPLRTDIACIVGNVARRKRVGTDEPQALPVVLVRWLQSHRIERIGGVPLGRLRVSLQSASRFIDGLLAHTSTPAERATLGDFLAAQLMNSRVRDSFNALLDACRDFTPVPESIVEDLRLRGFEPRALLGTDEIAAWLRVQRLHNLPVVLESFEAFDALFAWDQRGVRDRVVRTGDPVVAAPAGVALRAFFGEGGRRAYLVRTGDPSDLFDAASERFGACFPDGPQDDRCAQLPGVRGVFRRGLLADLGAAGRPVALSASDWAGLEHVYGLRDVSFALLPDLIDACAQAIPADVPPAEVVAAPERFVECVDEGDAASSPAGRRLPAPRLNALGLDVWRRLVIAAVGLLDNAGRAFHRRDVQVIASLPLLGEGRDLPAPAQWIEWMSREGWLTPHGAKALLSDRVQLAYPWVRSGDSADAQGGVEAPEGTLAGVLARSALERGAYRSAAYRPLQRWQDNEPAMAWTQATQQSTWTPLGSLTLAERVCLLGPSPRGAQLLSDVSCSADAHTRQASVRRLVNVVIQASRQAGDEFAFDSNGEVLWSRVRERLTDLMRALLTAGALSSDGVPYTVKCGRDTMRQNDIDAGRLIAQIEIQPAQPIQRIVVVLNLRDAGAAPVLATAA